MNYAIFRQWFIFVCLNLCHFKIVIVCLKLFCNVVSVSSWLTALSGAIFSFKYQNTNSKKLTIKKLSKSGLGRCAKFGQANSNNERKTTLSLT